MRLFLWGIGSASFSFVLYRQFPPDNPATWVLIIIGGIAAGFLVSYVLIPRSRKPYSWVIDEEGQGNYKALTRKEARKIQRDVTRQVHDHRRVID